MGKNMLGVRERESAEGTRGNRDGMSLAEMRSQNREAKEMIKKTASEMVKTETWRERQHEEERGRLLVIYGL